MKNISTECTLLLKKKSEFPLQCRRAIFKFKISISYLGSGIVRRFRISLLKFRNISFVHLVSAVVSFSKIRKIRCQNDSRDRIP